MLTSPTPRQILTTLLPYLKTAGIYAQQIQSRIAAQPEKESPAGNIFSAALSDADLSIQTMIEVVLLGTFPEIRFFGEEYAQSYNTKYFRATDLGPMGGLSGDPGPDRRHQVLPGWPQQLPGDFDSAESG
jgi:myo-inositol-1(or 4)-monophosphatase